MLQSVCLLKWFIIFVMNFYDPYISVTLAWCCVHVVLGHPCLSLQLLFRFDLESSCDLQGIAQEISPETLRDLDSF